MKQIICFVALLFTGTSQAALILINGGFESGNLSPWYQGNGTPVITSEEAHTGNFSVIAFGSDLIRQDFSAILVEDINEVSFWAKRDGGILNSVKFFYDDGTTGNTLVSLFDTSDWAFFDVTSFLDAGKYLTGFGVYGTSPGPAYLDDFTIKANVSSVPEPASLALLGLGLAGLGYSRRKAKS